jgi:F0F1-type ATP synthase assembly protein I
MAGGPPSEPDPGRRPSGAPELPEILRAPARPASPDAPPKLSSLAQGFALGTDLLVTTAAGLVLGLLADRWLGTSPGGLLIGLAAGMAGALTRIVRRTARSGRR